MKNIKLKIIMTAFFAVLMITVCAIPCFAQFDMTGHYDPDGTTSTYYAYSSSECNRTINVSMYDLTGALRLALGDPQWRQFFIEGYLFVAAIYFFASLVMSRYSIWLEKRINRGTHHG